MIPSAPARGPVPPASGPEPSTPALADAGYWAPPQRPEEPGIQQHPGYVAEPYGLYPGRMQPYADAYGGASALPPGACTVATFSPTSPWGGAVVTISDLRASRGLQTVDLAAFFGAAAVLGSLFMAWYQFAFSSGGASVSVSITALTFPAGGLWRWLMLVFSTVIMVELTLTWFLMRARSRVEWPHRGVLALLCAANLALVIGAMVVSPFSDIGSFGSLSASLASGAYVGLAGALVGAAAAVLRLFTGPPALS